jgi:hypothetical protein
MSQKLDERISTLEQRLKQLKTQQQRVEQRRRTFESRQARKEDARRKILIGALVLARVQQGRFPEGELRSWLDEALTRSDERALFGLAARPES